jgi:glycosyltransferase involved in cell wall biosynthesis
MPEPVLLYDVDPVNPYGRELAAVLARDYDVTLVCSRAVTWVPAGVAARRVLAAPRSTSSAIAVIARRIFGVIAAILLARRSGAPIVVVWSRDAWDAFVLAMLAPKVVVIDHNPRPDRRATGLKGWSEARLRRRARAVVVHDRTAPGSVVTHPAYIEWRRRYLPTDPAPRPGRVLLLGAVRPDKGTSDLATLLAALPAGTEVTVVGKGRLPALPAGVRVDHVGGGDFVPDERLAAELARGGVVLAPYPGATQSGTVILAITCALPVLGYAAGALPSVLTDDSLADVGDATGLAELFVRYQHDPWPTARVTAAELTERCARDWQDVLSRVTAGRTRR